LDRRNSRRAREPCLGESLKPPCNQMETPQVDSGVARAEKKEKNHEKESRQTCKKKKNDLPGGKRTEDYGNSYRLIEKAKSKGTIIL